jgi:hypothetical protein
MCFLPLNMITKLLFSSYRMACCLRLVLIILYYVAVYLVSVVIVKIF